MPISPPAPKVVADPAAIRRLRYGHGYTIADLARAAEVGQAQLSRVEHGKAAGAPSFLKKIADVLGVTVADITIALPADTG